MRLGGNALLAASLCLVLPIIVALGWSLYLHSIYDYVMTGLD